VYVDGPLVRDDVMIMGVTASDFEFGLNNQTYGGWSGNGGTIDGTQCCRVCWPVEMLMDF
jgi:hypothetical protein